MDSTAFTVVILGGLVFAAHVFTELFSRKRVPDILLLLIIGIVIGPILKLVTPESIGSFGNVFSTIAIVIILFESGSEMNFSNIKDSFKEMSSLTLISYFSIMVVIGILSHYFLHLSWMISFFLGAVLGGAAESIVIPLTKSLKIGETCKTTMVLETSFSTVLCFITSIAIFNAILDNEFSIGEVIGNVISSFILAGILGFLGAVFWAIVLQKIRTVKNSAFTTPAFVFIIYGINTILGFSGEIAALTFGITLANIDSVYNSIFKRFFKKRPDSLNYNEKMLFSEVAFLLKTFVFVYIGISMQITDWKSTLIGLIIVAVLFILRIISIRLTTIKRGDGYTELENIYMSCLVSKGLAAAILATMLTFTETPGAEMIKNIVYSVIFISIILTCLTIPLAEKSSFFRKIMRFFLYFPRKSNSNNTDSSQDGQDKKANIIDIQSDIDNKNNLEKNSDR